MRNESGRYMTVGQWLGTLIISSIPVVGLIFNIYWLFGGGKKQDRVNYVRASLLYSVIITVITVVAVVLLVYVFNVSMESVLAGISENASDALAA